MSKLTVKSKQQINMSHSEYMSLHRRMYAIVHHDKCYICLNVFDQGYYDDELRVDVTRPTFDSFLTYEMDFNLMLNIFSTLCMKLAKAPCPF